MATAVNILLVVLTAFLVTVLSQSTDDLFDELSQEELQQEMAELKERINLFLYSQRKSTPELQLQITELEQRMNFCLGTYGYGIICCVFNSLATTCRHLAYVPWSAHVRRKKITLGVV